MAPELEELTYEEKLKEIHLTTLKERREDYLKGREMRTVVKDEKSEWREVKSGVSQGSVLASINVFNICK